MYSKPADRPQSNCWLRIAQPLSCLESSSTMSPGHVRLGSLADIGQLIRDVRFTPKADMFSVEIDVRYVP